MRLSSLLLSLVLHIALVGAGILIPMGARHIRIDLERPVYEVKLVNLPKAAPAPAKKPAAKAAAPQPKAAAAPVKKEVVKPAPKPQPKPEAKTVSPKKEQPKPKPAPEKKPPPKPKPAPEKTPEQILAEALGEVRKSTPQPARPEQQPEEDARALALASAQEEAERPASPGSGVDVSEYTQEQLAAGYSTVVGSEIKANWRFPPINQENLVAEVEVRVGPDGNLFDSRIVQSSGREDFDSSILRAIESTEQVRPLPPYLKVDKFRITFRPESG